jgi:hypothetical protein
MKASFPDPTPFFAFCLASPLTRILVDAVDLSSRHTPMAAQSEDDI